MTDYSREKPPTWAKPIDKIDIKAWAAIFGVALAVSGAVAGMMAAFFVSKIDFYDKMGDLREHMAKPAHIAQIKENEKIWMSIREHDKAFTILNENLIRIGERLKVRNLREYNDRSRSRYRSEEE